MNSSDVRLVVLFDVLFSFAGELVWLLVVVVEVGGEGFWELLILAKTFFLWFFHQILRSFEFLSEKVLRSSGVNFLNTSGFNLYGSEVVELELESFVDLGIVWFVWFGDGVGFFRRAGSRLSPSGTLD